MGSLVLSTPAAPCHFYTMTLLLWSLSAALLKLRSFSPRSKYLSGVVPGL
jgi:hypothetical protein